MGEDGKKQLARAKNTAYRFLSYRQRSRAEVNQKLLDKEFAGAIIDAVLADLARLGYVNDRQFASQWASGRVRLQGFGKRRIEQELKNKGVDREIIREALVEVFVDDTEIETAQKAAEKKLNTMRSIDRESRRRRLAGFLERKGFSHEIIWHALKNVD